VKRLLRTLIPQPWRERLRRAPRHAVADLCRWSLAFSGQPIRDLSPFEKRYYSQNGEDGILEALFAVIGTTNRVCVEFGVEDGSVCNTRRLIESGWTGLRMDPREPPGPGVRREFVTAENIESLLDQYRIPTDFDLLSIDVDGMDFWIWKAIRHRPRVVVIEYNATIPPQESRVAAYDPEFRWDGTDFYGASLLALQKLGAEKGYRLVGVDSRGVNSFFVRGDCAPRAFTPPDVTTIYRPFGPPHVAPPHSPERRWVTI
jgi:hypothetical protein